MKSLLVRVILIMGLFSFIFGCLGCSKGSNSVKDEIKFSSFSDEEKMDYVRHFFKDNYNLDCTVSEVEQRQVDVFENEDDYFAIVTTPSNKMISVWISKVGEITDTYFLLELESELSKYFQSKAEEVFGECKVISYTELREKPSYKLSDASDIENYLEHQSTFSYIRIFVEKDINITEKNLDDFQSVLCQCDSQVYIYVCEDLQELDIVNYDISQYSYTRKIERGC